jgi:uncharacterized protein DUF4339
MSERSWFFASDGQQRGPVPEAQLRELIAGGTIAADVLVWSQGMADWQRAADVPGLVPDTLASPTLDGDTTVRAAAGGDASGSAPGKMQELEIGAGMLARIYWLFVWRSFLGSIVIGFVIGFILGFVIGAFGGTKEQITIMGAGIGIVTGLVWSLVCLKMALKKKYSDFRIVLVPRDAEPG